MTMTKYLFWALLTISTACSSKSKETAQAVNEPGDAAVPDAWTEPPLPVLQDECPPGTVRNEKEHEEGRKEDWCERPNGQRHGPNRFFFPSGIVEMQANIVDGKTEGPMVAFYEDGAKRQLSTYKKGLSEGPVTIWREQGGLERTGFDRHGRGEGVWTDYDSDGKKWKETHYVDGVKHGAMTEWDTQGSVTRRALYDHGKLVSDTDIDAGPSGK